MTTTSEKYCLRIFIALMFWCLPFSVMADSNDDQKEKDQPKKLEVYELTLQELANIQVYTGSLTSSDKRTIPGALTTITQEMIEKSGARRMDELLEIYVPNLQMLRQTFQLPPIGMRGILKDDDASILYMVNGRILNRRSLQGAQQERDLPMMGDIHHIDVLRGPNSSVYGPGGVTGIINVVTFDGDSFEGHDVKVRVGAVEEFKSMEARSSYSWGEDSRLFITAGVAEYDGADPDESPFFLSKSFTTGNSLNITPGEAFDFRVPNDHQSARDQLKKKLYLQYNNDSFEFWARYTSGGSFLTTNRNALEGSSLNSSSDSDKNTFVAYQQIATTASYNYELNSDWNFDFILSYDLLDFVLNSQGVNNREDEYNSKVLAHWNPNDSHKLVFGTEYSHEIFGKDGLSDDGDPTRVERQGVLAQPWSTNTYSLFAEHQWAITPEWTSFLHGHLSSTRPMIVTLISSSSQKQ